MNGLKLIITAVLVGDQRVLRDRRVRARPLAPRAPGSDAEDGQKGAGLALDQLDHVNDYISAVQIGVTMTSIAIGALGEPALADLLKNWLPAGWSHGIAAAIVAIFAFTVISFAQLIGGEIVPKFYAIDRSEAVARRVARPLRTFKVASSSR